jgi:tRNA pseudouridine55 synthase
MTAARSGVLVAAKPRGRTSFDVVAAVRRALRVRPVGHAGTLDPDAIGVLPIMIGEATKLMPYLADQDKEYLVTVRFGVTTDTLDLAGRVLTRHDVPPLERTAVEREAARFVGRIRQVPPMYSALHHEGRRLYELAREGREVAREGREVVVHAISVEEVHEATARLRIVCGKGTYVRVLAADLGDALGVGAAVAALERSRVGPFTIDEAVSWDELRTSTPEHLWTLVRPPASALAAFTPVHLDDGAARAFVHGQSVRADPGAAGASSLRRVHDRRGELIGIGDVSAEGRLRPVRILHVDRPGHRILPA